MSGQALAVMSGVPANSVIKQTPQTQKSVEQSLQAKIAEKTKGFEKTITELQNYVVTKTSDPLTSKRLIGNLTHIQNLYKNRFTSNSEMSAEDIRKYQNAINNMGLWDKKDRPFNGTSLCSTLKEEITHLDNDVSIAIKKAAADTEKKCSSVVYRFVRSFCGPKPKK